MNPILVYIETDNNLARKSIAEAVSYASQLKEGMVIGISFGNCDDYENLAMLGLEKLYVVSNNNFTAPNSMQYAEAIAQLFEKEQCQTLVFAKSSLSDGIAARVSVLIKASLASNCVTLPDTSNGYTVKRSIYTGKAFATTSLTQNKRILSIKKNAITVIQNPKTVQVLSFEPSVNIEKYSIEHLDKEQTTGTVLLPEADIVLSG